MPRSAWSMTLTRSTIPAPPPNGVSSTCPPLSGVNSRGLNVRSSWPCCVALRTWRWVRNQSNHSGNSVRTSSCTRLLLAQERQVDVDRAALHVDVAHRVGDQRDQQLALAADLEHLARRVRQQPLDHADLALAVDDAAALEVLGV